MRLSGKGAMKRTEIKIALISLVAIAFSVGCSRDPNVRKQRYVDSGNRYLQKHQYREAAIQFQNAIQLDPRYAEAHYRLAQSLLILGQWSSAYRELVRTTDLAPDNLNAQIDLGNVFLIAREFDQAQQRADSVLQRDTSNVKAHILRANALAGLQNAEASLQEMEKAIELGPNQSRSYLNLGVLQSSPEQAGAAEESFKKAVSLEPKSTVPHLALGNFYARHQRWSEAQAEYQQAIDLEPKNLSTRVALCELFLAQNQISKAEEVATQTKAALKDTSEGYRILGDLYFRIGDVPRALQEYGSLFKEHPKDLRVEKNYIQLLIFQKRLDEAEKLNNELLKSSPNDDDSLIARGQILLGRGRASDAISPLETALKNLPDNAAAHYYLGLAFDSTGDSGRAQAEWRESIRLDPNLIDAQRALAAMASRNGDADELSRSADAIIATQPNSPDGYVLRAAARATQHNPAGAEADLKKAIGVAPQNPSGFTAMAQFLASQRKYADAEKFYGQALGLDPNSTPALQGQVAVLVVQKQPDKALAKVSEMIAKVPGNSAYYVLQSNLLLSRTPPEFDKAETALIKASDLNKNQTDVSSLLLLSQLYAARGSIDKAVASGEQAIQHNPKDARAHLLLGAVEDRQGQWQKAQELYKEALQLQPDFPLASNNLAYLMLEHGENSDVALSLAQTARKELPDNPNVADTLAWAYYKKGSYKLTIDLVEEALKKTPDEASFHYHLGLAYQKLDEKANAKTHLQRALQMNPAFDHAAEARSALAELD
jgi:tetratricopeptide (TPR) repeat protein